MLFIYEFLDNLLTAKKRTPALRKEQKNAASWYDYFTGSEITVNIYVVIVIATLYWL